MGVPKAYFLPFRLSTPPEDTSSHTFTAVTHGIDMDVSCKEIYIDTYHVISSNFMLNIDVSDRAGDIVPCNGTTTVYGGQSKSNATLELHYSLSAREINATSEDARTCNETFVVGFLRANLTLTSDWFATDDRDGSGEDPKLLSTNSASSTWMQCTSTLHSSTYSVMVNHDGRALDHKVLDPRLDESSLLYSHNFFHQTLAALVKQLLTKPDYSETFWHNDTYVE